jgi:5-methylcytosine-specific restriction endonuclease McrA
MAELDRLQRELQRILLTCPPDPNAHAAIARHWPMSVLSSPCSNGTEAARALAWIIEQKRIWCRLGRLRAAHIHRHPLCIKCLKQDRVTAANDVDHIVPFKGLNDPLRLDPSNLQSLCRPHHRLKSARQ